MCLSSPTVPAPPPAAPVVIQQQQDAADESASNAAKAAALSRGRGSLINPVTGATGILGPSGSMPASTKNAKSLF